jgi:hypothetical protein
MSHDAGKLAGVRSTPGEAVPGIEMESVLPYADPRIPAAAGEKAIEGIGLGERGWS